MALITAGRQPQVVLFFTADKDVLREAILSQQPIDAPGNMRRVLLALSFTQGSGTHEVVIVGDGAYGPLFDLDVQRSPVRHIQVAGGKKYRHHPHGATASPGCSGYLRYPHRGEKIFTPAGGGLFPGHGYPAQAVTRTSPATPARSGGGDRVDAHGAL